MTGSNALLLRWSVWAVPALGVLAAMVLSIADLNRGTFMLLNRWSHFTGDTIWPYITILGDTAVALTLFLPFAFRRRDIVWALLISGLLATLFVHGVKPVLNAPRPPSVLTANQITVIGPAYKAQSFPSGHTTTIFVAAALIWLHIRSRLFRYGALALALLVGLSRAVVGVHWPVDIAAGAAGGWIAGIIGTMIAHRLNVGESHAAHAMVTVILIGCAVALLAGLNTGYPQAKPLQYAIGALALGSVVFALSKALASNPLTQETPH